MGCGTGCLTSGVWTIDVSTPFGDFNDYWTPFLGEHAPVPSYAMPLDDQRRSALGERIRLALLAADDGTIGLTARAWAVWERPGLISTQGAS